MMDQVSEIWDSIFGNGLNFLKQDGTRLFFIFCSIFFPYLMIFQSGSCQRCWKKKSNLLKVFKKVKKSPVQLALNPFFNWFQVHNLLQIFTAQCTISWFWSHFRGTIALFASKAKINVVRNFFEQRVPVGYLECRKNLKQWWF